MSRKSYLVVTAKVKRGKDRGTVLTPHRNRTGKYVVSTTRFSKDQVEVDTLDEVVEKIGKGLKVRMSAPGKAPSLISPSEISIDYKSSVAFRENEESFSTLEDSEQMERQMKLLEVLARPQQARFKQEVIARDGNRCCVSGCEVSTVLHAAHIKPVHKGGSDSASNGIILRADLHSLFDASRLQIDPITKTVTVDEAIKDKEYRLFDGGIAITGASFSSRNSVSP